MTRIACPYCGFLNFSISAYCGRCERPIKADTPLPAREPRHETPPPLGRADGVDRPAAPAKENKVAAIVPPPRPPPSNDVSPAPLPIELTLPEPEAPRDAIAEGRAFVAASPGARAAAAAQNASGTRAGVTFASAQREPPPPPLSTELPPDEDETTEVPVAVASGSRLFIAWILDACVVLGIGCAVAGLEAFVSGGLFRAATLYIPDVAADWLATYPVAALHGAAAAILFSVGYALRAGSRGGRTIGRRLTGTILVRQSGRKLGPALVVVRTTAALFSFALFGAGFLWAIVDDKHRTWHDMLAGTVVVRRRVQFPPEPA